MTTRVRLLVRLGMLVPPFRSRHEPGQARTGRAGGHTSDGAWSHKLVSGHKPVRSRARSRGPAAQADSSRDDTNGQGGSGSDLSGRTSPIISDHRHLHWAVRLVEEP